VPDSSAQSIGGTLARLGRTRAPEADGDDVRTSREAIFGLLDGSPEPLTIDRLCRLSGLHANTVRAHLEVLHAAGRVARRPGPPRGPGRPPWLFTVAESARSARASLSAELSAGLDGAPAPGFAPEAARRWAEAAGPRAEAPAADPDEAVRRAADALEALGFDARVDSVGDRIELRSCPYAELVADRPLICDIHAALLGELLAGSGQPVALRRLDVSIRPGLCVAHLDRPDLAPVRTIDTGAAAEGTRSGAPGPADAPHPVDAPRSTAMGRSVGERPRSRPARTSVEPRSPATGA
jgi:predicted ArsR family transcriptional regulator